MTALDLHAITERYHRALDAKPGKGPISEAGIAAITDSVCDIPALLAEVERLRAKLDLPCGSCHPCMNYGPSNQRNDSLMEALQRTEDWGRAMGEVVERAKVLVSDWQANGNSRPLGDPTAATWQECALQLLRALDGEVTP